MLRTRSVGAALILYICALVPALLASEAATPNTLDRELATVLSAAGFTGTIQQTYQARIEANLGRPLDARLVEIGRLLWFDTLHSLHADNTCGGCHSPTNGFGDSQPMAIGVQNNGMVGPHRTGPRNQRRSPLVINTAFYPALMWNGRFSAAVGRSVRQLARVPFSARRKGTAVSSPNAAPSSRICCRRRRTCRRPS